MRESIFNVVRAGVCAAALVLCAPSSAADLTTELDELATAVDARLAGAAGTKEAKKLAQAAARLDALNPMTATTKDVGRVLTSLYGSKTADAPLLAEALDLLDCLEGLVESERLDAEDAAEQLKGTFAGKLDRKLASAQKKLDAAIAVADGNPAKSVKLYLKAFGKFAKAHVSGEKLLARQAARGPCGKIGDKNEVIATISAPGSDDIAFKGFGIGFDEFNTLQIQGCANEGVDGVCERVVTFSVFYADGSRETGGPFGGFNIAYNESSDFQNGNGPGIQDISWEGNQIFVHITESTGGRIKGCFDGTATATGGQQPETITISGSFSVKRR